MRHRHRERGHCGFGYSIDQLCAFCDPAGGVTPPPCCTESRTNLSQCSQWGHPLAATITPTTTVATNVPGASQTGASGSAGVNSATITSGTGASATGTAASGSNSASWFFLHLGSSNGNAGSMGANANSAPEGQQLVSADDKVFSTGELAGIIVGCVVGAAILGALLALLCMRRRGDRGDTEKNSVYGAATAHANESHVERPWMQSEEAMVKSPELGPSFYGCQVCRCWCRCRCSRRGCAALAAGKGRDSTDERPNSAMSGETGTDGRGTTIPAVKDQYSSHDICPGETVVAIYPYNATLNDEITLQPDDVVTVQRLYDDGWAWVVPSPVARGPSRLFCVRRPRAVLRVRARTSAVV